MQNKKFTHLSKIDPRIIWWILVALYTFILPDVFIAYRKIVTLFGQNVAGTIPVILVITAGITYIVVLLISKRSLKNLYFLIPCGIIAFLIMRFVSNPNKHIHIPEYVLMTWLLLAALSKDHKGKGIFILIFIYASLLGVVDELEQGIHPSRFYGWSDMLVNSASALIGVFTIMGLKKITATDWSWIKHLKGFKNLIWLTLFGFISAVIMCICLFCVQASGEFWGVYPAWLWIWNVLYLIVTLVMIAIYLLSFRKRQPIVENEKKYTIPAEVQTARLWIIPLLAILFYMHALIIYVSISGVKFT